MVFQCYRFKNFAQHSNKNDAKNRQNYRMEHQRESLGGPNSSTDKNRTLVMLGIPTLVHPASERLFLMRNQ